MTTLVTGAGSGLGRGLAHELAARGHEVLAGALTADHVAKAADLLSDQEKRSNLQASITP